MVENNAHSVLIVGLCAWLWLNIRNVKLKDNESQQVSGYKEKFRARRTQSTWLIRRAITVVN
jgi:hypothetical protein